jgi:hypothetical protein
MRWAILLMLAATWPCAAAADGTDAATATATATATAAEAETAAEAATATATATETETETATATATEAETAAEAEAASDDPLAAVASSLPFTLAGWVEAFYSFNFNQPSNGITNLRGFDNRHNSFQLSNVVLDLRWDWENLVGRIMLQWGLTPATYYLAEPLRSAAGTGVGESSFALWQFLQEANIGYRLPLGTGLLVEAGLFISPVGPEGMAVRDDFLYSRSNLFYGLPFYHVGIRLSYELDEHLTVLAWGINGWNQVLDNNDEKSFILQLTWTPVESVTANLIYVSGVERAAYPAAAPERQLSSSDPLPWRHLLDANVTAALTDWLELVAQLDAGFEPSRLGMAYWAAGALSLRVSPIEWLSIAARGDFFHEGVPAGASPIFWNGASWVSSATVGLDLHPEDHFSFRIEYRHDASDRTVYFRGAVPSDPVSGLPLGNAASQDTLTCGATAWF